MKYSLPDSAKDLLISDGKHLMRTLSLYEVLRRFSHILKLTPFRFEDFSAALLAEDQSVLLADVHIQLLKTLIREDRQQQTWLGPPDIRDSVNLYLHLVDHTNWPAALRIYLSADTYNNAYTLDYLDCEDTRCYPYGTDLETRLSVLEQLCDQFLMSVLARDEIVNGGAANDKPETNCRLCSKANGDLIACGNCPAIYHLKCSDPPLDHYPDPENGDETYLCALCRLNHVKGVTDCISDEEKTGNLKRHETLGFDKLGRRYWFLVRRLFVVDETEDDVRYYTTLGQFQEIVESLNENRHEKSLIENIGTFREEIERQMRITENLYETLLRAHRLEDGSYSLALGQDGNHRSYTNHYSNAPHSSGKSHAQDRDLTRSLNNKFCLSSPFKWFGTTNGHLTTITQTIRTSILKYETMLPHTFIHPCWQTKRAKWIKSINNAKQPLDYAIALTKLERCIKPVLFKAAWYDSVGFVQLIRSTFLEREELKKIDRQPRGFERNERVTADFELSERLGTMVKFSPKLKPVKHQVWKQKGEEYRLTGLNGWYWRGITHQPRKLKTPKLYRNEPFRVAVPEPADVESEVANLLGEIVWTVGVIDVAENLSTLDETKRIMYPKRPVHAKHRQGGINKIESLLELKLREIEVKKGQESRGSNEKAATENNVQARPTNGLGQSNVTPVKSAINGGNGSFSVSANKLALSSSPSSESKKGSPGKMSRPRLPPYHNFLSRRGKVRSLFVLPDIELNRLARSGGLKEARTFNYMAKPNYYIWPYGMTPRPTFRTCWLYRNQLVTSIQDVSLQLKVFHACIRWDDLSARPPQSGRTVIQTDDSTVTIELLKKRDRLPYFSHSEYLIRKTTTPNEQPAKYRKVGSVKHSTQSSRIGLRARRQVDEDEEKKPTKEEVWVSEYQLELWELKQFDERIERQKALLRERALREEAEKRRRAEEERRRSVEQERRRVKAEQDEVSKRARLATPIMSYQKSSAAATPVKPTVNIGTATPGTPAGQPPGAAATTPVLRYFRTEQGQIIRLPASYLQRGTPLILRHVSPGTNQTNTYIIRPQPSSMTAASPNMNNIGLRLVAPGNITMQQPVLTASPGSVQQSLVPTPTATSAVTNHTIVKTIPTATPLALIPQTTAVASSTPTVSQVTPASTTPAPTSEATPVSTSSSSEPTAPSMDAPASSVASASHSSGEAAAVGAAAGPANGVAGAAPAQPPANLKQEQKIEAPGSAPAKEAAEVGPRIANGIPCGASENGLAMALSDNSEPKKVAGDIGPAAAAAAAVSVGTVANEMAHDRHAPSNAAASAAQVVAAQQQQQQQCESSENQVQ